jgi:hypothetical protein
VDGEGGIPNSKGCDKESRNGRGEEVGYDS